MAMTVVDTVRKRKCLAALMDGKLERYQKTWKDSKIRLEGPVEGFSQVVLGNV